MPTYAELQQRVAALEQENIELREVEKKLTESEEKFRTLFEHAAFVIDVIDAETGIPVLRNKQFIEQMGYAMGGGVKNEHFAGEFRPKEEAIGHFRAVIENGPAIFERKFIRENGEERTFLTSAVPIKSRGKWYIQNISFDMTDHKMTLVSLKEREKELKDVNTALKVLLKRRDDEKVEIEDNFVAGLDEMIEPYVLALKNTELSTQQCAYVDTLESNLEQMKSPFIRGLSYKHAGFTRREIQIATLIRGGKTTKEISKSLALSIRAIESHRANIRKKLGIQNKKENLRVLLLDQ
jgi:PAS domain S-box-containing protein